MARWQPQRRDSPRPTQLVAIPFANAGSTETFRLGRGACFGESALNDELPAEKRRRAADVYAEGDCAVVELQATEFARLLGGPGPLALVVWGADQGGSIDLVDWLFDLARKYHFPLHV